MSTSNEKPAGPSPRAVVTRVAVWAAPALSGLARDDRDGNGDVDGATA